MVPGGAMWVVAVTGVPSVAVTCTDSGCSVIGCVLMRRIVIRMKQAVKAGEWLCGFCMQDRHDRCPTQIGNAVCRCHSAGHQLPGVVVAAQPR